MGKAREDEWDGMARRALLIANGRYDDERIATLPEVAELAAEFRDILRSHQYGGFKQVQLLIDESKFDVESAIRQFFEPVDSEDFLVLYYAGHSIVEPSGQKYFAATNTHLDELFASAIATSMFRSVLPNSMHNVLVLLDCDHQDPIGFELARTNVAVAYQEGKKATAEDLWRKVQEELHRLKPPPEAREHVDWIDDAPAETDLLQRKALAQVLASRLARVSEGPRQASFLIHVDGPWGSGKSTLLKFLDDELSPTHLVVGFNAWRNARVQPPWWSLLTTIRDRVINDRPWYLRPFTAARETWARARRSGAPYFLAMLITALLIGGVYLLLPPLTTTTLKTIGSVVGGVIAVIGILWAVGSIAAKALLWNSARGAQLLERSHTDPMGEVSAHFGWLIGHSRRPVVVFIDDLDRCDGPTVVEILEAVQTLARDQPRSGSAAGFVVAADGAWLRRAYEDHYTAFEGAVDQPGQPLGYLFQEKLFQLSVPVPSVGGEARASYLNALLGGPGTLAPALAAEQAATSRRIEDSASEAEILDALKGSSQQVRQNLAPQAAMKLAEPEIEAVTEHSLEKFAPRLQANPRGVKRFLNTYSILRTLRTLEGNVVGTDTLAAWALLRSRWPQLADHLEHNPQDIDLVRDGKVRQLPKPLRQTVPSPELREFLATADVALTEADIRACCGSAQSSP